MRNLNDACNNAKSYKTRAGAEKKLNAADMVDFLGFVFERWDGEFVAVAIVSDKNMWAAGMLARAGIFVTNG